MSKKFCPQCGAVADEKALFCSSCGSKLPELPKVCPGCGTPFADGARFCAICGTPLGAQASPLPQTPSAPAVTASPVAPPSPQPYPRYEKGMTAEVNGKEFIANESGVLERQENGVNFVEAGSFFRNQQAPAQTAGAMPTPPKGQAAPPVREPIPPQPTAWETPQNIPSPPPVAAPMSSPDNWPPAPAEAPKNAPPVDNWGTNNRPNAYPPSSPNPYNAPPSGPAVGQSMPYTNGEAYPSPSQWSHNGNERQPDNFGQPAAAPQPPRSAWSSPAETIIPPADEDEEYEEEEESGVHPLAFLAGKKRSEKQNKPKKAQREAEQYDQFQHQVNGDGYYNDRRPIDDELFEDDRRKVPWLSIVGIVAGVSALAYFVIQLQNLI